MIEKRKKKRKSTILANEAAEDQIEVKKSKKKKKKQEHDGDDVENNNNNNVGDDSTIEEDEFCKSKKSKEDVGDEIKEKKKKKKNRKSKSSDQDLVSSDTENCNNGEDTKLSESMGTGDTNEIVEEENIKMKKKKKKIKHLDKNGDVEEIDENVELENKKQDSEERDDNIKNGDDMKEENKEEAVFPVLGKQQHRSRRAVKRNLPRWLAEPSIINTSSSKTNIEIKLGDVDFLSQNTINNLKKMSIEHLFPVQSHVVPTVMDLVCNKKPCFPCRDICVQSPTGSGKTLTYVLPVIEAMSKNIIRDLQCLVVLPTKDLAAQVKSTFDQCVVGTCLKVGLVAGVKSFAKEQESIIISRSVYH